MTPSTWADLLVDALQDTEQQLVRVLAESEAYRACLLAALTRLQAKEAELERTRTRLRELLAQAPPTQRKDRAA